MPERLSQPNKICEESARRNDVPRPLFYGGWVLSTPAVIETLTGADLTLMDLVARHLVGDWGDVNEDERLLNDLAVVHQQRITSAYKLDEKIEIWVVTAADRQATWLKFPEQDDPVF